MATVLVTGGTGFFGHNLVKALLEDPRVEIVHVYARNLPPTENRLSRWAVDGRSMISGIPEPPNTTGDRVVQSDDPDAIFANARVRFFRGDICDSKALSSAAEGCSVMFHACGDTRWWNAIDWDQGCTNIQGTDTALRVARSSLTIRAFIHTSTVDVMGHADIPINEDHEGYSYADFGYNYADTKRDADLAVQRSVTSFAHEGKRVVIIRPASMLGPWDVSDQYGRLFGELKSRSLAGVPCGGTSVCHVHDVALAHITAAFAPTLEHSVFICAGTNMTYLQLFQTMRGMLHDYKDNNDGPIGGLCGKQIIPRSLLVVYGWLCECYSNVWSGEEPEVNTGLARYMS